MYNLIVKFSPWRPDDCTMHDSRVFEYTAPEVGELFLNSSKVFDHESALKLPTLFMQEGLGDQIARVGRITEIKKMGREYHISYEFDATVPEILNATIAKRQIEFGIEARFWELSRTHWAIKNVDLYKVLLRLVCDDQPKPTVFKLGPQAFEISDTVAVMMPFSPEFDAVYAALGAAAKADDKICNRADDIWRNDVIMQDIVSLICKAGVVICDLTAKNPNVFYEAGIAHTLGKEVILITQSVDDAPFNLRSLRCIQYRNDSEGLQQLTKAVLGRLQKPVNRPK